MMKNKTVVLILVTILFMFCISISSVYATNDTIEASIDIVNSNNESLTYMPPESGGNLAIVDLKANYENCLFKLYLDNNYGETISTDLGTFTFEEYKIGYAAYIYTCPVDSQNFANKNGSYNLTFNVTNPCTSAIDTIVAPMYFFNVNLSSTSNLKVGDTVFIQNGTIIKDVIYIDEGNNERVFYDKSKNILYAFNYSGKISYSDMGSTFNIDTYGNCNIEVSIEDTSTGIKLDAANANLPKTVEFVVEPITTGETYKSLVEQLKKDSHSKIHIYDLSLRNAGVAVQPNGEVKISIPIPEDMEPTNLVAYRISESEKDRQLESLRYDMEYKERKFVMELDHFSLYVIAEKKAVEKVIETTDTTNEKDSTPKTGTVQYTNHIVIVTLLSGIGIILFQKHCK